MTLLEVDRKNRRLLRIKAQIRRDRRAYLEKWCRHCPWKNEGSPCVLPRCFRPDPKKREEDIHDKETV